eukprot:746668-Hanusia_phi.AAC.1
MKNPRIKEFLMKELRTNDDVQKAFRYITKSFLPDEIEGSRGLISSNISNKKYQAIWRMSPRTRRKCATPIRKICQRRVTMTENLYRELEVFCTDSGAHGVSLRRTIEKMIDELNMQGESVIMVTVNSDCTKLTKGSSSKKCHTEITISIVSYHTQANSHEWIKKHETRLRYSANLVTLMIIPDKDSKSNIETDFWGVYMGEIQELIQDGIHIHQGKAFRGIDKTRKEGIAPQSKIAVDFKFRADLAGHYAFLGKGGPNDNENEFCIHCNEKLGTKKTAKFFGIHVTDADSSWNEICKQFCVYPKDMNDLNLLIREGRSMQNLFELSNQKDFDMLRSDANKQILDEC